MPVDTSATITSKTGAKKVGKQKSGVMAGPKDATINDRDRLQGLLTLEKHLLGGYTTGLAETFERGLYNSIKTVRSRNEENHTRILESLFNTGEYTADLASPEQIADACDIFTGYLNQLPY